MQPLKIVLGGPGQVAPLVTAWSRYAKVMGSILGQGTSNECINK